MAASWSLLPSREGQAFVLVPFSGLKGSQPGPSGDTAWVGRKIGFGPGGLVSWFSSKPTAREANLEERSPHFTWATVNIIGLLLIIEKTCGLRVPQFPTTYPILPCLLGKQCQVADMVQ